MASLFGAVARTHGLDIGLVRGYTALRNELYDAIVLLSFTVLYAFYRICARRTTRPTVSGRRAERGGPRRYRSLVHLGAGRNDGVPPLDRDCREFPSWQLAFELSGRAPAIAASRCVALHQLHRPLSADSLGPFPSLPRTR